MDSHLASSPSKEMENRAEFRKLSSDSVHRKYRRRSHSSGSSSDGGRFEHGKRVDSRESMRESDWHDSRRPEDYHKHYDRSSRSHRGLTNYARHEKHGEDDHRHTSSRYGRESKGSSRADHVSEDSKKYKYKGSSRCDDQQGFEKYDSYSSRRGATKRDYHSNHSSSVDPSRDYRDGRRSRDSRKDDEKAMNSQKDSREYDSKLSSKDVQRQDSLSKKQKLFDSNNNSDIATNVAANELQSSKFKPADEAVQSKILEVSNDVAAAKVNALKAAELVNKNLVGVGVMSTEQKKKLLWGNKKSTTSEESAPKWNTAMFGDRERQEKFNKLMGVKGDAKVDAADTPESGGVEAERQKELQMDLEKQYTAGLRRRDGRTVGLGL